MPADEIVLVCIRFFFDAVVNNEHRMIGFDLANKRLDDAPEISAGLRSGSQETCNSIVTNLTVKQLRQTGRSCLTERADKIIGIEVQQRLVHMSSLLLALLSA